MSHHSKVLFVLQCRPLEVPPSSPGRGEGKERKRNSNFELDRHVARSALAGFGTPPCHSTWTRRSTRRRRRESQRRGHHADCPGGTRFHRRPSVRSAVASRAPREHPPPALARHFVRPRIPAGVSCRHRRQRSLPASASARVATVALPAPGSAPPCRSVARVWWSRPHALLLVTVPANSGTSCVHAAGLLGGSWSTSRRSPRRVVMWALSESVLCRVCAHVYTETYTVTIGSRPRVT